MELDYVLMDPTGNVTALVRTPVEPERQPELARALMDAEPSAEQTGFIEGKTLNMAGGEFCGNATISAAAVYCHKNDIGQAELDFAVSGARHPVHISIKKDSEKEYTGTVYMPEPLEIKNIELIIGGSTVSAPAVDFGGITHIILNDKVEKADCEESIKRTCASYGAKSLGFIFIEEDKLTPLVYVTDPETLVWESSCASGTAAAGIYFAHKNGGFFSGEFTEPGGKLKIDVRPAGDGTLIPALTGKARIIGKSCINI